MCLAIPGKIVEIIDEENQLAKVEVGGVRRSVPRMNADNADRIKLSVGSVDCLSLICVIRG